MGIWLDKKISNNLYKSVSCTFPFFILRPSLSAKADSSIFQKKDVNSGFPVYPVFAKTTITLRQFIDSQLL